MEDEAKVVKKTREIRKFVRNGLYMVEVTRVMMCMFIIVMIILSGGIVTNAQEDRKENKGIKENDIIFLLDCSQSVLNFDKNYMSFDFIEGLIYTVPSQYRFGIVGYNKEICMSLPLGSGEEEIVQALEQQTYRDYGNAVKKAKQQNENLILNCEANSIQVLKGKNLLEGHLKDGGKAMIAGRITFANKTTKELYNVGSTITYAEADELDIIFNGDYERNDSAVDINRYASESSNIWGELTARKNRE